jgi:hypothetical protein
MWETSAQEAESKVAFDLPQTKCGHEDWLLWIKTDMKGVSYGHGEEHSETRNQGTSSAPLLYRYLSYNNLMHKTNSVAFARFEVFTAVTMKNGVFWDVTPCGFCKDRRFGGT